MQSNGKHTKHNTQLLSLAMIVSKDTSRSIYIFFLYTTFQLVYIFIGCIRLYMNIKCKNKNTYSEGMALKCCM